ncbi:glycosyltransferase [Campylobacter majalis]|uniref:glycosyltransferase n=1 Tax=Campylobacter majalis TaxID=2790656 RepID=UPI003D696DA7
MAGDNEVRLLFVIAGLRNGGAERVLSVVSNALCNENEVHLAVLEDDLKLYEFNATIHYLKNKYHDKNFRFIRKILALQECFKQVNPDVIISFIDWTNVLCVIANYNLKFKHIATEHHAHDYLKSAKFRLVRDMAYRHVDMLSVLNKTDFEYYDFVKNKVILHNPLFLSTDELLEKQNVILSIGRLEHVKGFDLFFRALAMIDDEILSSYKVLVVGDGRLKNELKKLCDSLNLNVEFLGHQSDVSKFYKIAKVVVVASRSEGFCNVLAEAGAFGCVRITSDTAGARELVKNGIDAIVFENENFHELGEALRLVLSDEALVNTLSKNSKNSVKELSPEKIVQKWSEMIRKVVKK